jgi:hypothetical protein
MYSSEHALECDLICISRKMESKSVVINGIFYYFYTRYITRQD